MRLWDYDLLTARLLLCGAESCSDKVLPSVTQPGSLDPSFVDTSHITSIHLNHFMITSLISLIIHKKINFLFHLFTPLVAGQKAKKVQCNGIKSGWVSFSCGNKSLVDNSLLHVSVPSLSHWYYCTFSQLSYIED